MISDTEKLEKKLLILAGICGGLILFVPVQYLLLALIGLIILIYLLANPKVCFYLVLIFSTYVPAFSTENQQMPFNQTDILISICFVSTLCRFIFVDNAKVNLRTKIDAWLIVLLILYFFSGMTSLSHRGYQGFLKMGEVIAVFYMTVYFLRTKVIKLSELIKVMLFIGVFQSLLGTFQSITGIGANFQDPRGYLGILGIGSPMVWHAKGFFPHFNVLGPFLSNIFLFFLPINHFISKNKKRGNIILFILFLGVIKTYSRGTLMSLIVGALFFVYQIQKDKKKFLLKLIPPSLFLWLASIFVKSSSYMSTISPRNDVWELAITAATNSPKSFFFGYGLTAYRDAVWSFLPVNIPVEYRDNYLAHSFYLYNMVEMGLIGASVLILFLINNIIVAFRNLNQHNKITIALSIAVISIIISLFIEGTFDMAFNHFVVQIWLFLVLGIMYSKMSKKRGDCYA